MFKNNKRYKIVKEKLKNDPFELDEQNRELVDITIMDTDCLLSIYRPDGKKVIDSEMAQVIKDSTKATTYKKDIHLRISCENHAVEKEVIYKNAITNYFVNEFAEKERRLKNNLYITLLVFFLSIISFGILYFLNKLSVPWLLFEFFDVVAWVFAWETVNLIFFQRISLKYEQNRDLQIVFAQITFIDINSAQKK